MYKRPRQNAVAVLYGLVYSRLPPLYFLVDTSSRGFLGRRVYDRGRQRGSVYIRPDFRLYFISVVGSRRDFLCLSRGPLGVERYKPSAPSGFFVSGGHGRKSDRAPVCIGESVGEPENVTKTLRGFLRAPA